MVEISVVVACYNGAGTLAETLESLAAQAWDGEWEIVLADNGSTDASAAVFAAAAARAPGTAMWRVDASATPGKASALNVGVRAARGRGLLFCDADDAVAPGWLAAMAAALARHDFVAARMDYARLNPDWALGDRRFPQQHEIRTLPYAPYCRSAAGGTLGFRRGVFEALGGFDPDFRYLEDTDFCIRAHLAGFALAFVPDAVLHYRLRHDPAARYRQTYNYARYRALLHRRYGPDAAFLAPRRWSGLAGRIARPLLGRMAAAVPGRRVSRAQRMRLAGKLGEAMGEMAGAIAFRTAPAGGPRQGARA